MVGILIFDNFDCSGSPRSVLGLCRGAIVVCSVKLILKFKMKMIEIMSQGESTTMQIIR